MPIQKMSLDVRVHIRVVTDKFLSNGRGIRKGTQGSLLAWRTASLLLVKLLFCIKLHMRDDGKAAEGAKAAE